MQICEKSAVFGNENSGFLLVNKRNRCLPYEEIALWLPVTENSTHSAMIVA